MIEIPIARPTIGEEEIRAVSKVIRSGFLAQGPVVRQFEEAFAKYCGTKHAVAINSGTAALHAALIAAGIGNGDSVIVPSFTFFASASAVSMCGATPLFADVDDQTFMLIPESVKELITPSTKAVMGVHLFGQPFAIKPIQELCEDHNLILIEDAAQAHGAQYHGQRVGGFGLAGCFSFYPTKNMTTGEGGMVTTNDSTYAEQIRQIINHGQSQKYLHTILGYNYRMTDIGGALGIAQLKKLDKFNEQRNSNAAYLNRNLSRSKLILPTTHDDIYHVYHQYVVRVTPDFPMNRDALAKYLNSQGIGTAVHYPLPLHRQPFYRSLVPQPRCPVSDQLASEVLSLPIHPLVTEDGLHHIVSTIIEVA